MKAELHLVLAVGVVLCLTTVANADVVFDGGGVYIINYAISNNVVVMNGTDVKLDPTGSISGYLRCWDTSVVTLSGGTVGGNLEAYGNSDVSISGGMIGGVLIASLNGQITIYGTGFNYNYGELPASGHLTGTLDNGDGIDNDFFAYSSASIILAPVPGSTTNVAVDIKPGNCPNPLNIKSRGVLTVAVLGSDDFDVTTIDANSIRLAGVDPIRRSYEDVATPVSDGNECECITEGPDGYRDLTLKFKTRDIINELEDTLGELIAGEELVLTLTGFLNDGTLIEGADCVLILGAK